MSELLRQLETARKQAGLRQADLAEKAGVNRMTISRMEEGAMDPRLSTVLVAARALGLDLMLVPKALTPSLTEFIQSGGKMLAQPVGASAPRSIVDAIVGGE